MTYYNAQGEPLPWEIPAKKYKCHTCKKVLVDEYATTCLECKKKAYSMSKYSRNRRKPTIEEMRSKLRQMAVEARDKDEEKIKETLF